MPSAFLFWREERALRSPCPRKRRGEPCPLPSSSRKAGGEALLGKRKGPCALHSCASTRRREPCPLPTSAEEERTALSAHFLQIEEESDLPSACLFWRRRESLALCLLEGKKEMPCPLPFSSGERRSEPCPLSSFRRMMREPCMVPSDSKEEDRALPSSFL